MALNIHSKWLERQFDGTEAMDLDATATPSDIRIGIFTNSTINVDTVEDMADLTEVATGTSYTGPVALTGESCSLSAGNLVFDANDPGVWSQDASGFTNGRSLALMKYSGTAANDYVLASHIEGSAFSIQDGDITVTFNASGIWTLSI